MDNVECLVLINYLYDQIVTIDLIQIVYMEICELMYNIFL